MRPYNPDIHHRHSIRLQGHDYSQPGAYFLTICVHGRDCLLGDVNQGAFEPNLYGDLVAAGWRDLPDHYPHIRLDQFVVMPNHVHGIIVLTVPITPPPARSVGAGLKPAPTSLPAPTPSPARAAKRHALPEIVRAFKTFTARRINIIR